MDQQVMLTAREDVRHLIERLKDIPVRPEYRDEIDSITHSLSILTEEYMTPRGSMWDVYGLTKLQQRIAVLLWTHKGNEVPLDSIMNAMYGGRIADDWPNTKNVHVQIFKLRKKLRGSPYSIENRWGGYVIHEEPTPALKALEAA